MNETRGQSVCKVRRDVRGTVYNLDRKQKRRCLRSTEVRVAEMLRKAGSEYDL